MARERNDVGQNMGGFEKLNQEKIEHLLERWREKEELSTSNKVMCKTCGAKQRVEKNLDVLEGPAILQLQLNRYSKNDWEKSGKIPEVHKIERHTVFELELSLKRKPRWGIDGWYQQYKLRGVIEHKGKTTKEGHYHAYVREGDKCTQRSDENSIDITWEEVQK